MDPEEAREVELSEAETPRDETENGEASESPASAADSGSDPAADDGAADLPSLPLPELREGGAQAAVMSDPRAVMDWQNAIQSYEAEIGALAADDPRRALLYYECGRIWDDILGNKRNAGANYQKAFQLNRALVPNIRAARRLFAQAAERDPRNWEMVLRLVDAELEVRDQPREAAALHIERFEVFADRLEKGAEARTALEEAISLDPANLSYLKLLERTLTESGDFQALYDAYGKALDRSSGAYAAAGPEVRADLLSTRARLAEEKLEDAEAALENYERAYDEDPRNQAASQALERLYARFERWAPLARLHEAEAAALRQHAPAAAVLPLYLASRIHVEYLDGEDRAVELLGEALEISPEDLLVLGDLSAIHERQGNWQALAEIWSRFVHLTSDERELITLFFNLGQLYEHRLYDEALAIEHYRRVCELDPAYVPALQALGGLHRRKGNWEELAEMYAVEAQAAEGAELRVSKHFKRAEILEEHLGRDDDAIEAYQAALADRPDYKPALQALGRLFARHERYEDLVEMYDRELTVTEEVEDQDGQAASLLLRIAGLAEDRLKDLGRAASAYERIGERRPDELSTLRNLARLYAMDGQWEKLVATNEEEIRRLEGRGADDAVAVRQRVSLLHKNGELQQDHLADRDEAVSCYRRALELDPSYLPSLMALGQLYQQRGSWQELVGMYQRELEVTTDDELRATLLYKVGHVFEQRLLDEQEAIAWYERALETRDEYGPAIKALIRIHAQRRDWDALVALYQREYESADDLKQKVSLAYRMASLYEDRKGDPDKAIEIYTQAHALAPDYLPTVRALVRLFGLRARHKQLVGTYETEIAILKRAGEDSQRHEVELRMRMAEIYAERLDDDEQAVRCYEAVIGLIADHVPALRALEKHYRVRGEFTKLLTTYERLAACTSDKEELIWLRLEIAALRQEHLRGWGGMGEPADGDIEAAGDYLGILELDPAHPEALSAMEDLYRRCGDWAGLVQLLERRRTLTEDRQRQLELSMAIADIAQRRLDDDAASVAAFEAALQIDSGYLPAIRSLKGIFQKEGNWQRLTHLLEAEGQVAADGAQAVAALYQAGTLREGFGDVTEAIEDYERVLALDPANSPAFNRMEGLLRQSEAWDRLIEAHQRRLEVAPGAQARAQTWLSIGRIYEQELDENDKAIRAYLKALEERPDHFGTMQALGDIYFSEGRWDEAMSAYYRIIDLATGRPQVRAQDLVPIHLRLGEIFERHRPDPHHGRRHLEAVLALEPDNRKALASLASVYRQGEEWDKAAEALGRLINQLSSLDEDEAVRSALVKHYRALAEVMETGFKDPAGAAEQYAQALRLRPDDADTTKALCRLYEGLEDWPKLLEAFESLAGQLHEGDPLRAVPLYIQRAEILDQRMGQPEAAVKEYRRALGADPNHMDARCAIAELYARDSRSYDMAIEEHRRILEREPLRLASFQQLYEVYKGRHNYDRAWVMADVLVQLGAASGPIREFYEQLDARRPAEPTETLGEGENERYIVHPAERGFVHDLFAVIGEDLCKAWPSDLDGFGLGRGDRLNARSDSLSRKLVDSVGAPLGVNPGTYDVYQLDRDVHHLGLESAYNNAAVLVGAQLRVGDRKEVRARIGPLMQRVARGQAVPARLDLQGLTQLVVGTVGLFDPDLVPGPKAANLLLGGEMEDIRRRLTKGLGRRARRTAEEIVLGVNDPSGAIEALPEWAEAARWSGDRAAMAVTGDLASTLRQIAAREKLAGLVPWGETAGMIDVLGEVPAVRELMAFVVSDGWFGVRERLGLAIV